MPEQSNTERNLTIDDFDWTHLDVSRHVMMSLLEQIKTYENRYEALPLLDSQAARESALIPEVTKAYDRAGTLMMNAFDHAYSLNALLENRTCAFAPWTSGRVILEACALASWMLDNEIVCRERVLRCTKLRLRDIRDQRLHYINNLERISNSNLNADFEEEQRGLTREVERLHAIACEFRLPIQDRDIELNRFKNLGSTVKITDLVSQYFPDDVERYQTLSGIAHCNEWSMYNLGMRLARPGTLEVEPSLVPFRAMHLVIDSTRWIGETMLRKYELLGTDTDEFNLIVTAHQPEVWMSSTIEVSDE